MYVPKAVNAYCVTWLASIFSLSLPGPYGFYARTKAPKELIAPSFLILSLSRVESTLLERLISYVISKQARLTAFRGVLFFSVCLRQMGDAPRRF